ncbi:MAG: hypoxanthine phosphoribosyltransferase [Peptostreptococcaceae bacterium]|nr:hypoxanthine phosphoribosyltransferase [Peptostreptococcaceae bacterium]
MDVESKRKEVLFTREEIQKRVKEMGLQIRSDYEGKKLITVSLLKGSFVFTADLVREIDLPIRVEFMTTSSYGHATVNSGKVKIVQDIEADLSDYDVLVVDDIADSGVTLDFIMKHLAGKNPKSLASCVLLDKPSRRVTEIEADYVGFTIPDKFIVGYGLNYGHYYRNVPYIFAFVD